MRNKDTILLEGLYDNDISSMREKENPEKKNNKVFSLIASDLNERSNPSGKIFDYLDEIKKSSSISELVSYLNENEYWEAKDKLIKLLFSYYTPSGKI
jgi:hypothetical protein